VITEAMQAAGGQSGHAKREAREFLLDRLEAGPVPCDDILDEAKQNGISEKTLRRAKKDLRVVSRKGKMNGEWTWELPPKPRPVDEAMRDEGGQRECVAIFGKIALCQGLEHIVFQGHLRRWPTWPTFPQGVKVATLRCWYAGIYDAGRMVMVGRVI
jgi:hypothetical protein